MTLPLVCSWPSCQNRPLTDRGEGEQFFCYDHQPERSPRPGPVLPPLTKEEADEKVQNLVNALKPPSDPLRPEQAIAAMSDAEVVAELRRRGVKEEGRRKLVYMMHPLGNGTNREYNRKSACLWQAALQEAHPEWLVLAPWIGLSGAWTEARRELGMQTDFATIDVCDAGVIAGPLDGPRDFLAPITLAGWKGVSPGMADELRYFFEKYPSKPIYDARRDFLIKVPVEAPPIKERPQFKPRFKQHEYVHVENKQGGVCRVKVVEETAPGVYRYLIEQTTTFFAHEQALVKVDPDEIPGMMPKLPDFTKNL